MDKMQEAFDVWWDSLGTLATSMTCERRAFEAGYQAAIAAVREGGPVAWWRGNGMLTNGHALLPALGPKTAIPLYRLPEEPT